MKNHPLWIIGFFLLCYSKGSSQIIVSEIMYDPNISSNNEFIEIYNAGTTDVDVANWKIVGTSTSTILITNKAGGSSAIVKPKSFAVIFYQNYFSSPIYSIPNNVLLLSTDKILSLNNTGSNIELQNSSSQRIVFLTYIGIANKKGYSLEKIFLTSNDASSNYAYCTLQNGTPGIKNTQTPFDIDASTISIKIQRSLSFQNFTVNFSIQNVGVQSFSNGKVTLYLDKNNNKKIDVAEEYSSQNFSSVLEYGKSLSVSFPISLSSYQDTLRCIGEVKINNDLNTTNDTTIFSLALSPNKSDIIINEFLYEPLQDPYDFKQDNTDFIELYNQSSYPINLTGWKINDRPTETGKANQYTLSPSAFSSSVLNPNEYAIIFADTEQDIQATRLFKFYSYLKTITPKLFRMNISTLSLNNDGDDIKLIDGNGKTIDSLSCKSDWHNPIFSTTKGLSLEKFHPSLKSEEKKSWTTAIDRIFGGSPGKQNSVYLSLSKETKTSAETNPINITPNPFSPDTDGFEDVATISYSFAFPNSFARIRIFDRQGREVKTLANEPISSSGIMLWNGLDDHQKILPIGPYIILFEITNLQTGEMQAFKKIVVLAKKF